MASFTRSLLVLAALGAAASGAHAQQIHAGYSVPFGLNSSNEFSLTFGSSTQNANALVINGWRTGSPSDTFGPEIPTAFSTFCVEVGENIQVTTNQPLGSPGGPAYLHLVLPLLGSTTLAGGFTGPITFDATRTDRLELLWGLHFDSTLQTDMNRSAAFQLAVWEIAFDNALALDSGMFSVTGSNTAAIALANQFLTDVLDGSGPRQPLYLLRSDGNQDLITAAYQTPSALERQFVLDKIAVVV
ncbi:hypothetical protein J4558_17735 [Leptolyngbya sp. 15MV]|nr:hypothetical protein J4558_17735 [Leptolyngbya sp. 15MV]